MCPSGGTTLTVEQLYIWDLRMRDAKSRFEIASLSVAMIEIPCIA